MLLRHDNGLVFGSRRHRAVVADHGLTQEYITPSYTPQQNGLCERFIKTFKEEFAWERNFKSIEHARLALRVWINAYHTQRPHQALNYKTPTKISASTMQSSLNKNEGSPNLRKILHPIDRLPAHDLCQIIAVFKKERRSGARWRIIFKNHRHAI